MNKTDKNQNKTTSSLSYEITYSYNEKRLSQVSKPRKNTVINKSTENEQSLKKVFGENASITCDEKLNWQNLNCAVQKIYLSDDGSRTITIDTPTIGSDSKISFNINECGVWRNF